MAVEPATGGAVNAHDDLAARYEKLTADRQPFLDRARECAKLTIPALMPEDGHNSSTRLYTPYQSIGARGVNNLANKILLSILPPNQPFFRLTVDDATVTQLAQDEKARAQVEEKLNEIERTVQTAIETSGMRAPVIEGIKQILVAGNCLIVVKKDGTMRVHRLDTFVVQRDVSGNLIEAIVREEVARTVLPDDVQELLSEDNLPSDETKRTQDVAIYTRYYRDGDRIRTYQTVEGHRVPGSEGSWPVERAPIIALRWNWVDNEDYGRSYIEEYLGDLTSSEGLSKAIVEAAAAAAKVVIMVRPSGVTRESDITEAENLDVITGVEDDVTMLQLNKQADMAVAQSVLNDILKRLSHAFLMNTSVTRDAERVTAEEVRFMIGELEDALGGTYALLSQEFQLPLVRILMDRLADQKRIPRLPKAKKNGPRVEPTITTGVDALGRGHDLSKYQVLMREIVAPLGEAAFQFINVGDLIKRAGVSLGIDMDGLVKDQEQMMLERQQAMQAQRQQLMEQTMADGAKQAVGPIVKAATEQQG